VLFAWAAGLRINTSPSVPVGVYWRTPIAGAEIERGELVFACPEPGRHQAAGARLPSGWCPGGKRPFLKRVAALPGDQVAMTEAGLRVNGQLLPESRIEPSLGEQLQARGMRPLVVESPVPSGFIWLLGEQPNSYDSRYFGPVPVQTITGRGG